MSRVLPILFNSDMIRSILDGRKTATRRCAKPKSRNACGFYATFRKSDNAFAGVCDYDDDGRMLEYPQTPPYQPGDILYVRETWHEFPLNCYHYLADFRSDRDKEFFEAVTDVRWRPSIHMPKEAARIWLEVTNVRVERLQDISDDDCMKEGIRAWTKDGKLYKYYPADEEGDYPNCAWSECPRTPKEAMEKVWDSTIKKSDLERYGWDANPWVWVIEFVRCEKPEE